MSSSSGFFGAWLSITPPRTYIIYMETQHFVFSCFFPFPTWAFFVFLHTHICPPRNSMEIPRAPNLESLEVWVHESHQWGLLEKSLWRLFCVSSSADARSTRSRKFATRHLEEVCHRVLFLNLIFESPSCWRILFLGIHSLKTMSLPLKIGHHKRERSSSNHQFLAARR